MSQAHAQKFYDMVIKDQALFNQLTQGNKTQFDFIAKVVSESKKRGLEVSAEDANTFMKSSLTQVKPGGELSDQQLESVAGGKVTVTYPPSCKTGSDAGDFFAAAFGTVIGYSWAWNP